MAQTWKTAVAGQIAPELDKEIDVFERQMNLRREGKMDEKVFAETRLRRGAYGQRYDNGQRHDGKELREITFFEDTTKGPGTLWHAPGMLRIKIPYGGLTPRQLEVIAECAEEYVDGILHVSTRQCVQLHFLHMEDVPDLSRRLGAVGITTREACGNAVRNVTGCPLAGVCSTEPFDTTPYAEALWRFLLGHKDAQDFGRKMKISFSGCQDEACALGMMHDIGLVAREKDGKRGFAYYVGGGLGAVPHQAALVSDFVTEEELLPISQCVCRIFGRLGEKKNRSKARIKFLVAKLGIEEFRKMVEEERKTLPHDDRWTDYLKDMWQPEEKPALPAGDAAAASDPEFIQWKQYNTKAQRQQGYSVVKIALPLGDITARQTYALAEVARKYMGETQGIRLTVDQNIYLRFVPNNLLAEVYAALKAIDLANPIADTIVDVTSCPGTDTCKLGISASRGLAGELRQRLAAKFHELDEAVKGLTIKVSGCFNSCGQHHIADIGFYGISRKRNGYSVPHFQMILGGQREENAGSYGLPQIGIPAKRIPEAVDRITGFYAKEKEKAENFQAFVKRVGKKPIKALIVDLTEVPAYEEDPTVYTDWHDPREYTNADIGIGECAGELVETVNFGLADGERLAFDAQIALDEKDGVLAHDLALKAMLSAAKALVYTQNIDITSDPDQVLKEFQERLVDTKLFWDQFTGQKYADYFIDAMNDKLDGSDLQAVHRRVEEATLFIEACHTINNTKLSVAPV